jgi:hypothetical protein
MTMKARLRLAPLVVLGLLGGCQVVLGLEPELRLAECEEGEAFNTSPADCQREVCKDGLIVVEADPDDVRDDANGCTDDLCADTTPAHAPLPAMTPCGLGGLLSCNDQGQCQGCTVDTQCLTGPDNPCIPVTCLQGTCVSTLSPAGTLLPDPTPGDCMVPACDGNGASTTAFADDPPASASPCTVTVCQSGSAKSAPRNAGADCPEGVCDGNGTCVGCLQTADCGGGTQLCVGTTCVDHCTDSQQNHGENGVDCGGGGCAGCAPGTACSAGSHCASGACVSGVCCNQACDGVCFSCTLASSVGQCSAVPANTEVNGCSGATVCDGGGACKTTNGNACNDGSECLSGYCFQYCFDPNGG